MTSCGKAAPAIRTPFDRSGMSGYSLSEAFLSQDLCFPQRLVWLLLVLMPFPDQLSFFANTPLGKKFFRVQAFLAQCIYAIIWKQGMEHGSERLRPEDEVELLPIISQRSATWAESARTLWTDYGVIVLELDVSAARVSELVGIFKEEIKQMNGHIGPSNSVGLRTGGGLPYMKFCLRLRALPGFRAAFQLVMEMDGRWTNELPYIWANEAFLCTRVKDNVKGLDPHRDNKLVGVDPQIKKSLAPELSHLQGQLLVGPGPQTKEYLCIGCLQAPLAVTPKIRKNVLETIAARCSITEGGTPSFQPNSRGDLCPVVLGGPYLGLAAAQRTSEAELESFIRKNCTKDLVRLIPPVVPARAQKKALQELHDMVASSMGRLITSDKSFQAAVARDGRNIRAILIRALAGGLTVNDLWRLYPGGPNKVADLVYTYSCERMDRSLLRAWVGNAGQKRRMADQVWSQDKGKRGKHN